MTRFDRGLLIIQLALLVACTLPVLWLWSTSADTTDDRRNGMVFAAVAGAPFALAMLVDLVTRRRLHRAGVLGATLAPAILEGGVWLLLLTARGEAPIPIGLLAMPLLLPISMFLGYGIGRRFKVPL
jgi:hypothetical protein